MMKTMMSAMLILLAGAAGAAEKPNIILFMVDDMGWMDCGAYGSEYYKTPNIDRLAKQSMRFTDAYAVPLCSPTRASILTGQHSARHGITTAGGHTAPRERELPKSAPPNQPLLMPESKTYLDPSHITLAEVLLAAGYRTAHIGKWHLGVTEPHWPEAHGFEFAFHCQPSAGPPSYFAPYGVVPPGSKPDPKKGEKAVGTITDGPSGEHITDRTTDEAIRFVEAHRNEPFYLNYWLFSVHGPWQHKEAYTAEFAKTTDPRGKQGNPVMASMLRSVDEGLGRLLDRLDELKLTEKTIFIFYSDNGGNVHSWAPADQKIAKVTPTHPLYDTIQSYRKWSGGRAPTDNSPLRDGKGRLYEGGQRVPLMVRWPGRIPAGSTSDAIVGCIDMYPTILELAGVPAPKEQVIDGLSFASVLTRGEAFPRDVYFNWFPHLIPGVSVRKGDWKLIRRFQERPDDYEGLHELFNLKDDLGETTNLAAKHPEKVAELNGLIDRFVRETDCLVPVSNPDYKPRDAAPVDPLDGLVPKFCTAEVADGVLRVVGTGPVPFLGTARVKYAGPMTLRLRARSADGGAGKVQWTLEGQSEFPASGQTVDFSIPAGGMWQDIAVRLPISAMPAIVRLYLPAKESPVEIQSIRYVPDGSDKPVREWIFGRVR